jgi:hypothetical protein
VFAAGLAVTGLVTNDIADPTLLGLVLIVSRLHAMPHAFAGGITTSIVFDVERRDDPRRGSDALELIVIAAFSEVGACP